MKYYIQVFPKNSQEFSDAEMLSIDVRNIKLIQYIEFPTVFGFFNIREVHFVTKSVSKLKRFCKTLIKYNIEYDTLTENEMLIKNIVE